MSKLALVSFERFLNSPPHTVRGENFIYGSLLLLLAYVSVSFLLLSGQQVSDFKELSYACLSTGLNLGDCYAATMDSAAGMLGAVLLVFLITYLLFSTKSGQEYNGRHELFAYASSVLLLITLAAHYYLKAQSNLHLSRLAGLEQESFFISLENMLWPVVLQCMVIARNRKTFFFLLLVLFNNAVMSPYRGVVFAFIIFGLVVPMFSIGLSHLKTRFQHFTWRDFGLTAGALTLIGILVIGIAQDSSSRAFYTDSNASGHGKVGHNKLLSNLPPTKQPSRWWRIEQRLTYPFYQSVMAEYVVAFQTPPSLANEFLNRLRIPDTPTLNQVLYQRLYRSKYGQTTFLYYGEGAAYSAGSPFIWATAAPLLLVAVYLILARFGLPVGTLIAVAIWRGSMSGLFNILPSLIVQLCFMIACFFVQPRMGKYVTKPL